MAVKIKKDDTVKVITGKSKGQEGSVTKVIGEKVVVEGVNIVKKHQKPSQANPQGGIIEEEAPIHISNVKLVGKKAKSDK
jgi:large subunit ribosomal protein L24